MKKGFTLLEIIVVLIIIGIIATLGFMQYTKVIEKGRTAEAKTNLGTIRTMAMAYYEENGGYPNSQYLFDVLGLSISGTCSTAYFYSYTIDSSTGAGTATRCTGSGKKPDAPAGGGYTLTLTQSGQGSSDVTGMW